MEKHKKSLLKLAEMLILFAVLIVIDAVFMDGDGFAQINPNPYWLPVIIMTLAYGTSAGLAAAIIASLIWISVPHNFMGDADSLGRQFQLSVPPMLWIVAALIIGEVTASRAARIESLQERYAKILKDWEKMGEAFTRLVRTNRNLQVRIATDHCIAGQAMSVATGLIEPGGSNQRSAVSRLIALSVQSEDFTFYHVVGQQVVARLRGAAAQDHALEVTGADWVQALVDQPDMILRSRGCARSKAYDFGSAAIPVCEEKSGALSGILVIHSARRLRLTTAKLAELKQVAESLGRFKAMLSRPQLVSSQDNYHVADQVA